MWCSNQVNVFPVWWTEPLGFRFASAPAGLFVTGATASSLRPWRATSGSWVGSMNGRVVAGVDLDDHLTSGNSLNARQIESMVLYFRTRGEALRLLSDAIPARSIITLRRRELPEMGSG